MGINTDLNIDPYFDDFDETKQFNRVLFKPARAVQARELTQLQTILQNQVERFGSNIYKEGTVISGINIEQRNDIFYIKLNDQVDFVDPTIYISDDTETYTVVGETSQLRAQIIDASNGFQTRDPDLKTFYIKYLDTGSSQAKQFIAGEALSIRNSNDEQVLAVTAANVENFAGPSFGIKITEGIIYQKGHFIFVEAQDIIVEKYSRTPDNVSVGFEIEENLINANQDQTLLDNAQGYNNENAPGADRLQLRPILRAYASDAEPAEFFALIRYSGGEAITIRDVTQFNSIATEMARRTYEESGNYVVKGMNIGTEQFIEDGNLITYATVSPGKAYVFGYEVSALSKRYLTIDPSDTTITKTNQGIGASYSGYYTYNNASGQVLNGFAIDGTRYALKDSGDSIIGYCSIANLEPGKIYVYAVTRTAGQENTAVAKIGDTPVTSQLIGGSSAAMLFDSGKRNVRELSNVVFTRRFREVISPGSTTITIEASENVSPLVSNVVVVDSTNQTMGIVGTPIKSGDNVVVTVDDTNAAYVYYDAIVDAIESDTLTDVEVYVKTLVSSGTASLGLPNVVKVLEIIDQDGAGADVTSKFTLVNNQKEGFYDISYLQLKTGQTLTNSNLRVKMVALRRSSTYGNAYLDAKSYQTVDKQNLRPYTNKRGITFDLSASVDFRPYVTPFVNYSFSASGAPTVSALTKTVVPNIAIANDSTIFSDQEFYLSRIDSVVVDSTGIFSVVKGIPSDTPSQPEVTNEFVLGNVFVSGGPTIVTTGIDAISTKTVSTRNYTMKDIEGIERQVERLTDAVSLSLLELETNSLFIDDGAGNNRFKNGILVDSFKDLSVADFSNGEYKAAIDTTSKILSPSITQFPVDLKFKDGSNLNTGFKDVITLADTGVRTTTISQKFATGFRNAASNFYLYNGEALIFPQFDSGYDVVQQPATNIDIDIATPLLDLVDNLQEFIPLTRSTAVSTRNVTSRRVAGGTRVTTTTNTTTTTRSLEAPIIEGDVNSVGNYVTDFSLKPYARRREVQILVTGLRPNTIHHFFFDKTLVDEHVFAANANPTISVSNEVSYDVRNVVRSTSDSSVDISTDENGILAAVFVIPESTFFVGDLTLEISDVDNYSSIKSAGTSYSRKVYHSYNFGVDKQEITYTTRSADFAVNTDVSTSRSVSTRFIADPPPPPPPPANPPNNREEGGEPGGGGGGAASCFVAGTQVTMADGSKKNIEDVTIGEQLLGQDGAINNVTHLDHWPLAGRLLIGINGSGPFKTPEHPLMTKQGWKAFNSQDTIEQKPQIAHLMVNGNLEVGDELLMEDGSWVEIKSLEVFENEPEQTVYNFVLDGNHTYFADGILAHNRDPLSQTFYVKSGMANSASAIFVHSLDIFFKGRSASDVTMADITNNGVTIQIREVVNGYPAPTVLPFASKHLTPSQVLVSEDGSIPTTIIFDNPIKLNTEKEYTFVVMPDATDPNYLVYTSKVGGTDIITGVPVTQDWGDGVLFTSTNNRTWKSYQDEDVKFNLKTYNFTDSDGYANLVPNDPEFFTISGTVNEFLNDEVAYVKKSIAATVFPASVSGFTVTVNESSVPFSVGDYIVVTQGTTTFASKITDINSTSSQTVITTRDPSTLDPNATGSITVELAVGGKVEYFNRILANRLHLTQSSARETNRFEAGDTIVGLTSGATATIDTVEDVELSYFQPMLPIDNTVRTTTTLDLYEGTTLDKPVSLNSNIYLTTNARSLRSKSRIVDSTLATDITDDFVLRLTMSNRGATKVTPVFDAQLSMLNSYQYNITEDTSSSSYVAKEIILQEGLDATGLKVLVAAYRPAGTYIDVYARFVYPTNVDEQSDWIKLENANPNLYSNVSNVEDYREFEYNLADETNEFSSFQLKAVLRHATDAEILANNLNVEKTASLFPHVKDYRAIALT